MDENQSAKPPANIIVRRIPTQPIATTELPKGFKPLRLTMKPGGICLELGKTELIVGRHSSADVRLPMPDVSRQHCRLSYANSVWQIEDLGSLNGIQINGQKTSQSALRQDDQLSIGGLTFSVDLRAHQNSFTDDEVFVKPTDKMLESIASMLPPSGPEPTRAYRRAS